MRSTRPGRRQRDCYAKGPSLNQFDHRFTQRTIKVVFDGALGSRGAALLEPYADAPETSGLPHPKRSGAAADVRRSAARGIQIETHAIGDRANRVILDLYEKAMKAVPPDAAQNSASRAGGWSMPRS